MACCHDRSELRWEHCAILWGVCSNGSYPAAYARLRAHDRCARRHLPPPPIGELLPVTPTVTHETRRLTGTNRALLSKDTPAKLLLWSICRRHCVFGYCTGGSQCGLGEQGTSSGTGRCQGPRFPAFAPSASWCASVQFGLTFHLLAWVHDSISIAGHHSVGKWSCRRHQVTEHLPD